MPIAWITEYGELGLDGRGQVIPIPAAPALRTQRILFSRSMACDPFLPGTRLVRILTSADGFMLFCDKPGVATAACEPVLERQEIFRRVKSGMCVVLTNGEPDGER
jgi:hypothetical protein